MKITSGRGLIDFELDKYSQKSFLRRLAVAAEVLICPSKMNMGTLGLCSALLAMYFSDNSALTFGLVILSTVLFYVDLTI
jgi:hypothetical protein